MLSTLSHVALFASLFISCTGNPTYYKRNNGTALASSDVSPVTENIETCGVDRVAKVTIGNSDKILRLVLDTGSCWTWVKRTSLGEHSLDGSADEGSFKVTYAIGKTKGRRHTTKVTVGGSLVIEKQVIGVADTYDEDTRAARWDGVMGFNPSCHKIKDYPLSVLENLPTAGVPSSVAMSFTPLHMAPNCGHIIWGGSNSNDLLSMPLTDDENAKAKLKWPIDAEIGYQGNIKSASPVSLDSDASEILLAPELYEEFIEKTHGVSVDFMTEISSETFKTMGNLDIIIGGHSFPLTPKALQGWYEDEEHAKEPSTNGENIMLRVDKSYRPTTILGIPFFERYLINFKLDEEDSEVGIGRTQYSES